MKESGVTARKEMEAAGKRHTGGDLRFTPEGTCPDAVSVPRHRERERSLLGLAETAGRVRQERLRKHRAGFRR